MPQNSRYCNVIPQKLCEYELNRGDPAETAVAVVRLKWAEQRIRQGNV